IIAVMLGRKQYEPIRNLANLAKNRSNQDKALSSDELENIHHIVSNVFESYDSLSEKIDLHKPYARDQLLITLLKGETPKDSDVQGLLESVGIDMHAGGYFAAIAHFEESANTEKDMEGREKIVASLNPSMYDDYTVHGVDLLYEDAII